MVFSGSIHFGEISLQLASGHCLQMLIHLAVVSGLASLSDQASLLFLGKQLGKSAGEVWVEQGWRFMQVPLGGHSVLSHVLLSLLESAAQGLLALLEAVLCPSTMVLH